MIVRAPDTGSQIQTRQYCDLDNKVCWVAKEESLTPQELEELEEINQRSKDAGFQKVELLDPIDPEDRKLLIFCPNGQPAPAKPSGTREYDRAKTSIQVYHLHYYEFVRDRRAKATSIRLLIQEMDEIHMKIDDQGMKSLYKERQKALFFGSLILILTIQQQP
jgi:hypothetical protein